MDWDVREVRWPADPVSAVAGFAAGDEFAWLDTAAAPGRCSLVCSRPSATLEQSEGQPARWRVDGRPADESPDLWNLWRRAQDSLPRMAVGPFPLMPGWVGYLGFELAQQLERLPASHRDDLGLPIGRLALFDRGIVLDHAAQRAFAVQASGLGSILPANDPTWVERWDRAAVRPVASKAPGGLTLRPESSQAEHEKRVARAIDYIAAGDIYQVNLAHRLWIGGVSDPATLYAAARRANPAPYAALLRWGDAAIASLSPELFVRLNRDAVLTSPIKGTRPRTGIAAVDARHRRELVGSAKEAAELAMIIDLHRNDLGRVCRYGSVQVRDARRVEAHPTVYHTVADVVGRLRPACDGLDLLRACFPAGSISGVPKIRALEIIDELEPVARGAYTGAVGVWGLDGRMTFNVAIRTLQIRGRAATLYVGGGIVADSDPAAEYEETLAKARGILRGLGLAEEPGGSDRQPAQGAACGR